jgi:hypothetical protein
VDSCYSVLLASEVETFFPMLAQIVTCRKDGSRTKKNNCKI